MKLEKCPKCGEPELSTNHVLSDGSGGYICTAKTQFASGAIRDSQVGKADYIETIPWIAMERYAQYMTGKKSKYGSGNFKKGIDIESYEKSMVRHVQKYLANKYEGGTVEKEEDHISAIIFNALGILYEEERAKQK